MKKVQVVYGRYTALDTVCKRCEGHGKDPTATQSPCLFCGGSGVVVENLGRPYTYLAPDGTKLWDVMLADAAGGTKHVTVVSLTSRYDGPCKEAYPLPPTTMDCPGCGQPEVSRKLVACGRCWRLVPQHLKTQLRALPTTGATFGRVRIVGQMRNWLKENATT
jgi:hypothetical protein